MNENDGMGGGGEASPFAGLPNELILLDLILINLGLE